MFEIDVVIGLYLLLFGVPISDKSILSKLSTSLLGDISWIETILVSSRGLFFFSDYYEVCGCRNSFIGDYAEESSSVLSSLAISSKLSFSSYFYISSLGFKVKPLANPFNFASKGLADFGVLLMAFCLSSPILFLTYAAISEDINYMILLLPKVVDLHNFVGEAFPAA